jgi:hypothetical protein
MPRSLVLSLLLVALLAAADLWSEHHFGVGIRNPGVLAVLLAAVGAAWGLVGRLLTGAEREQAEDRLRLVARAVLVSPATLLVLGTLFLLAVLLFSSVTIVAEPGLAGTEVTLRAMRDTSPGTPDAGARDAHLDGETPQVRFGVLTSALAGPYVVRASGYLPTVVEAPPLFGARVRLGRDAARSPAVLLRPSGPLLDGLQARGYVSVARRAGGRDSELARSAAGAVGSFLLGRRPAGLRARVADWDRELLAAGVTDAELRSRWVIGWLRVQPLEMHGDLAPGDTLVVRVVARSGRDLARERIVLGTEDEDLLLQPAP